MKASALTAIVFASLAGVAFASPRPQTSGLPLPACVTTCINQVVGTGACTDASDKSCLCSSSALSSCVQSGCPPSFVDDLGQYCGTGPFSSSTGSSSSQPFTIQTNTLSGGTVTPTTTATTTSAQSPGVSPAVTTKSPATSAAPAGNAGDPTVNVPGLKGILTMGLAFVAGALFI